MTDDSGRDPVTGQFLKGFRGGPGRSKGSRNRLSEAFLEAMEADWNAHGVETIEKVRDDRPDTYLKIVADLLPRDVNLNLNENADLNDAQLIERIRRLDATIRPFLATAGDARAANGAGSKATH